jgi:hypothetical protein
MARPLLYCIHNRDWPVNCLTENPLFARGTFMGAAYQSALDKVAGIIPDGPLPEEAMKLFRAQVAALPNMQNLQDAS